MAFARAGRGGLTEVRTLSLVTAILLATVTLAAPAAALPVDAAPLDDAALTTTTSSETCADFPIGLDFGFGACANPKDTSCAVYWYTYGPGGYDRTCYVSVPTSASAPSACVDGPPVMLDHYWGVCVDAKDTTCLAYAYSTGAGGYQRTCVGTPAGEASASGPCVDVPWAMDWTWGACVDPKNTECLAYTYSHAPRGYERTCYAGLP
jgi:hypothetical protein